MLMVKAAGRGDSSTMLAIRSWTIRIGSRMKYLQKTGRLTVLRIRSLRNLKLPRTLTTAGVGRGDAKADQSPKGRKFALVPAGLITLSRKYSCGAVRM